MAKYTIALNGYGGEFIAGIVKEEFLDALNENDISIDDYAENNLNDYEYQCIPEDVRPFDPGEWYNIDPYILHTNFCDHDSNSTVTVDDEDGNTVYESPVNVYWEDGGHNGYGDFEGDMFSIYDPDAEYLGKTVYTCMRNEEGLFFEGTLEIDQPFNPRQLELQWGNFNERDMVAKVIYYTQLGDDGEPVLESAIIIDNQGGGDTSIDGQQHELMTL